jgi:hypothetical protein
MRVLVAYPLSFTTGIGESFIYLPLLAQQDSSDLQKALAEVFPQVLVVGNNIVSSDTLTLWREFCPLPIKLFIIRKGTSLARIDCRTAEQLDIEVLNIKGVNSPFVALFALRCGGVMKDDGSIIPGNGARVGCFGSGGIGAYAARLLATHGYQVSVFSPSLCAEALHSRSPFFSSVAAKKGLHFEGVTLCTSMSEATTAASVVVVAIDADGIVHAEQRIGTEVIEKIPSGAVLVNVSESKVFSPDGLALLLARAGRGEINFFHDSVPADVSSVRSHVAHNSPHITFSSLATRDPACQKAMNDATLELIRKTLNRSM